MNPSHFHACVPMPFCRLLRWSMVALALLGIGTTAEAAQTTATAHLPDLSAYNCSDVSEANTTATRHIGQVIKGTYNEWQEYYVGTGDQQRLACIGLMRPATRQLNVDEAKTFLTNSFAIGAPAASAAESLQRAPAESTPEPANVQPEPIKRVRKPTASSGNAPSTSERPATSDLPPVPDTKTFDAPDTAPRATERSSGLLLTPEAAPAAAYESPQTVGVEDREQIIPTQTFPWNTVAYLSVTYPTGASFRCSAVVVSAYVVLTAGHCIHSNSRGGYISTARVYPGQTQSSPSDGTPIRPYGVKNDVQYLQTTAQWVKISGEDSYLVTDYRHDIAAIEFKTPFTYTSTFMPVMYGSTGSPVTDAGYPAEIGTNTVYGQYADLGNETADSLNELRPYHVREFLIDASGGDSGGPFFYLDPGTNQRYVVGLLSYGEDLDDAAGGPWYDSWNQSLVSGWVSWKPGAASTGSVAGLRVASVFGTQQPNVLSFLRFYNTGTSSGTVDVTLADGTTGSVLATWTSPSLPGRSSRQFAMVDIENNASATFTKPINYSVSVRASFNGTFQNVLFRKTDGTLTNLSTCDSPANSQNTLMNVHSSLLQSNYPSAVVIYNTSTTAVQLSLGIYSAQTGLRRSTYLTSSIPANGQLVLAVSTLESGAGISPSGDYHYNIRSDTSFTGYMQHLVSNQAAGVTVDMTTACTLSAQ